MSNIRYKTWDNSNWEAFLRGNDKFIAKGSRISTKDPEFMHGPNGDFNHPTAHPNIIINYLTWDGTRWTARVVARSGTLGDNAIYFFVHAPNGDWNNAHADTIINYIGWGGEHFQATIREENGIPTFLIK